MVVHYEVDYRIGNRGKKGGGGGAAGHSPIPLRDNNTCNIFRLDKVPSAMRKHAFCLNVRVPLTSRNSNFFSWAGSGVVMRASVSRRRGLAVPTGRSCVGILSPPPALAPPPPPALAPPPGVTPLAGRVNSAPGSFSSWGGGCWVVG